MKNITFLFIQVHVALGPIQSHAIAILHGETGVEIQPELL